MKRGMEPFLVLNRTISSMSVAIPAICFFDLFYCIFQLSHNKQRHLKALSSLICFCLGGKNHLFLSVLDFLSTKMELSESTLPSGHF